MKKGALIWTSRKPIQLPPRYMTGRHDEVVPIEVFKPLFGPDYRRPVVIGVGIRIRDTLFCPRLLKVKDQSRSRNTISEEAYLVSADVEVEGSYLPADRRSTSSSALNMVKQGTMTATTSSGTKGTDTLHTSLIVEDAGERGRHMDDESDEGKF